jgi:ATP-dependent Clp protease ATP-binding subunit ClpB
MTSNLGSAFLTDTAMARVDQVSAVNEAVRNHFKPEFLNRIDDIVIFNSLTRDEIASIATHLVSDLAARVSDRNIQIELTEGARQWLMAHGYDAAYGARPLRRLIQKSIGDRIAKMILGGQVSEYATIKIDAANIEVEELKIEVTQGAS